MRLPLLISLLGTLLLHAQDQVALKNGDQFIGTLVGLSQGLITLDSPHSTAPLEIKSDQLANLSFKETPTAELPTHSHQLNLRNGDVIPGKITGLDATTLQFQTWFTGKLSVPRSQIKSLFCGVAPQKLLYQGPTNLEEWEQSEEWELRNGSLTATSKSSISRDLNLPQNFIFRFNLKWQNSPNARIHFCTTANTGPENTDGYYLNFINRGIELIRSLPHETKKDAAEDAAEKGKNKKNRLITLGTATKQSGDFHNRQGTIELRVERTSRMIHLYIDDQFQGSFLDPHPAPKGTKIIFDSLTSIRRQISISAIKLRQWDAITQRLRIEPRQDEKSDTLTTNDGDRYSGQILNRLTTKETPTFEIKSPLLPQNIHIPEHHTAILYFRQGHLPENPTGTFRLALATGGHLNLSDIQLTENHLHGTHPWLGKLTLDRRILSQISLQKKAAKKTTETTATPQSKEQTNNLKLRIQAN